MHQDMRTTGIHLSPQILFQSLPFRHGFADHVIVHRNTIAFLKTPGPWAVVNSSWHLILPDILETAWPGHLTSLIDSDMGQLGYEESPVQYLLGCFNEPFGLPRFLVLSKKAQPSKALPRLIVAKKPAKVEEEIEDAEETPIPLSTFEVIVKDQEGTPLEDAEVEVDREPLYLTTQAGQTSKTDLMAGKYAINGTRAGYRSTAVTEDLASNATRQVTLVLERIKVALVYPPPGSTTKQFVNLPHDKNEPNHGQLKVEMRVIDGKAGDEIYLKLEYDKTKIHSRHTPKREVVGGAALSWCPQGGDVRTLKKDNEVITVPVNLGICGGDTFTIRIGSTPECDEQECTVVVWRRLYYEIWEPEKSISDFAQINKPKVQAHMDKVLAKTFISFVDVTPPNSVYGKSDLPEKGRYNIIPSEHFGLGAGKKVLVLSDDEAEKILKRRSATSRNKDKLVVTSFWMDYMTSASAELEKPDKEHVISATDLDMPDKHLALPWTVGAHQGLQYGDFPILKLQWRATHCEDLSSLVPGQVRFTGSTWKDKDPPPAGWKAITRGDPGYAFRNFITLTDPADLRDHYEITGLKTLRIKFPRARSERIDNKDKTKGGTGYPGFHLLTDSQGRLTHSGSRIAVEIQTEMVGYQFNTLGSAIYGDIWMTTRASNHTPQGIATVLLHELAHNMGGTYISKSDAPTYGRSPGAAMSDALHGHLPLPTVPTGFAYEEHGHRGPHCAHGLPHSRRLLKKFNKLHAFSTCLMFGATNISARYPNPFCLDCEDQLRGEDLSNIRRDWYS